MSETPWRRLWSGGDLFPMGGEAPGEAGAFGRQGRRKILFAGHEATRTGAPFILLRLMEAFARSTDAELFLFLERGGPLLEDYSRVAHVVVNKGGILYGEMGGLTGLVESLAPPGANLGICNSADSWRLIQALRAAGVPKILTLMHERASLWGDVLRTIQACSDQVIFPAEAVKAAAVELLPDFASALVLPQGLLQPEFGRRDRQEARARIREELGVGPDTPIVLGCGMRSVRKGVDLFVQLAARVRTGPEPAAAFVWLGDQGWSDDQFGRFISHDVEVLDLAPPGLTFVPETSDPEPYYLAADLFVLTSRDDPFPCVVHEAMACALPVIVFEAAGGAPEAIAGGCGRVAPYLDVEDMSEAVISLLTNGAEAREMGARAEARVRSVYKFSDYARAVMALSGVEERAPGQAGDPDHDAEPDGSAGGRAWRTLKFDIVESLTDDPLHCARVPDLDGVYLHPPRWAGAPTLVRLATEGRRPLVGFKAALTIDDARAEPIDYALLGSRLDGPDLAAALAGIALGPGQLDLSRPGLFVLVPWRTKSDQAAETISAEWEEERACEAIVLAVRMNAASTRSHYAQTTFSNLQWQFTSRRRPSEAADLSR